MTGSSPSERYRDLTDVHGDPAYERIDAPATREQKAALGSMSPDQVPPDELAGEPIAAVLTEAPGNGAPIGGLKVATESAWFAARPSGTEDVYKIYAESFRGPRRTSASCRTRPAPWSPRCCRPKASRAPTLDLGVVPDRCLLDVRRRPELSWRRSWPPWSHAVAAFAPCGRCRDRPDVLQYDNRAKCGRAGFDGREGVS